MPPATTGSPRHVGSHFTANSLRCCRLYGNQAVNWTVDYNPVALRYSLNKHTRCLIHYTLYHTYTYKSCTKHGVRTVELGPTRKLRAIAAFWSRTHWTDIYTKGMGPKPSCNFDFTRPETWPEWK